MSIIIPLIQKILDHDPDQLHFIQDLHNQKLGISITGWNLNFTLCPTETHLNVIKGVETADTIMSGNLPDFIALKDMKSKQSAFSSSSLNVHGDIRVLSLYQDLLDKLDISFADILANLIGQKPANLLAKPLSLFVKELKRQTDITLENLPEILQEEKRLLPSKQEIEDFYDDIKKLQMDVERMEAKMMAANTTP